MQKYELDVVVDHKPHTVFLYSIIAFFITFLLRGFILLPTVLAQSCMSHCTNSIAQCSCNKSSVTNLDVCTCNYLNSATTCSWQNNECLCHPKEGDCVITSDPEGGDLCFTSNHSVTDSCGSSSDPNDPTVSDGAFSSKVMVYVVRDDVAPGIYNDCFANPLFRDTCLYDNSGGGSLACYAAPNVNLPGLGVSVSKTDGTTATWDYSTGCESSRSDSRPMAILPMVSGTYRLNYPVGYRISGVLVSPGDCVRSGDNFSCIEPVSTKTAEITFLLATENICSVTATRQENGANPLPGSPVLNQQVYLHDQTSGETINGPLPITVTSTFDNVKPAPNLYNVSAGALTGYEIQNRIGAGSYTPGATTADFSIASAPSCSQLVYFNYIYSPPPPGLPWWQTWGADVYLGNLSLPGYTGSGFIRGGTLIPDADNPVYTTFQKYFNVSSDKATSWDGLGLTGVTIARGGKGITDASVSVPKWFVNSNYDNPAAGLSSIFRGEPAGYAYFSGLVENFIDPLLIKDFSGVIADEAAPANRDAQGYEWFRTGSLSLNQPVNIAAYNRKIILLADGNFTINANINRYLAGFNGKSLMMIIASGDIIINPAVTNLDAVLVADGQIITESQPDPAVDTQLVIRGTAIAGGGFALNRDLGVVDNQLKSAELFRFRPDSMILIPKLFQQKHRLWAEVAP